jgi:transcriptional regulator with XRE-family HTH domain
MTPKQLKLWRKRTGYSQRHLAKVLGVVTITVSRWERGVREIPSFLHLALDCMEAKNILFTKRTERQGDSND